LLLVQLIQQLDEELGIEKFRMELESTQVLVRTVAVMRGMILLAAGPVSAQVVCRW
jgi:L-fucose isomerase-like protein